MARNSRDTQKDKDSRSMGGKKVQTSNFTQVAYHPSTAKGSQAHVQHFSFEPSEINTKPSVASQAQYMQNPGKRSMSVKNSNQPAPRTDDQLKQAQKGRGSSAHHGNQQSHPVGKSKTIYSSGS